MPNTLATFKITLSVPGETTELDTVAAPYQARIAGELDVPDSTESGTEYVIPFGSVGVDATGVLVKNTLSHALDVKINGEPETATATLVAGEKTVSMVNSVGDRLAVLLGASNSGTPGYLHVRRVNGTSVKVESYTSDGIQDADISDFTVYRNGSGMTHSIPPGGVLLLASPVANDGTKITSLTVTTTASQTGAGKISFSVFGDPV